MIKKESRNVSRVMRHERVRKNVFGTKEMPRLNVFRSNKEIYAQIKQMPYLQRVYTDNIYPYNYIKRCIW